jgi:hypothetical protein
MAVSHIKSNIVPDFTGTVTVFNSVGSTETRNATDLVRPSDWNSAHNQYLTLSGNTAGASTMSGTNIVFQGGNNITMSANGVSLVFSGPDTSAQSVQTQSTVAVQGSTGAISFGNANGITFGFNASTVTASHNGLTSQSNQAVSAANGSSTFQTLTFANSNGVSFGTGVGGLTASVETSYAASNHSHGNPSLALTNLSGTTASNSAGLTISLSAAAPGAGGGAAISAAGGSQSTGTIVFSNSNGVSFGFNAGTITATVNPGAAAGIAAVQMSDSTYTSGTVLFTNANGISFGSSVGGAVQITHALQFTSNTSAITSNALHSSASRVINIVAATNNAGGGTASLSGDVSFSAANGVTFYTSAGGAIVGSVQTNYLTTARASTDAIGLNTALTANGVSVTANSSGLSLNFPAFLTTAALSNHSHGNPTLALTNLSGTTASNSAGLTLSLSAAAPGAGGGMGISAGTQSVSTGTMIFANSNNITFGMSGSSQITASYSQSNQTAGIYASSNTTGASSSSTYDARSLSMQFLGGVSGGWSNGSLQISGPALTSLSVTGALSASSNGSTISLGVGTVTVSATSNTTQASSGTVNLNGLIFAGAGAASVGVSNGSIVISAPNAGAGNVTFSAGTASAGLASLVFSNLNGVSFGLNGSTITASAAGGGGGGAANVNLLGANTSGNTTATGSTLGFSGVNLTLSGTNASQIVFSAPATSSIVGVGGISISTAGSTISISNNGQTVGDYELFPAGNNTVFATMGQNSIYFQKFVVPVNVSFNNIERRFSGSSVSSSVLQAASHTYNYGLYVRQTGASSSQYSLLASSSMYMAASYSSNLSAGWTFSQGAASVTNTSAGTVNMSAITGYKHMYMPFTTTMTANGEYAVAMHMSSATAGGTNPLRIGLLEQTIINNLTVGRLDTAAGFSISNASRVGDWAQGVYSATSSNLPATLAISGLTNAVSQARMYLQFEV